MGKALTKNERSAIKNARKPGERLVEATITIRWLTTDDLEKSAAELKAHTDQFRNTDRIRGYVDIGFKEI